MKKKRLPKKTCDCELCRMARVLDRLAAKATRSEKAVLNIMWERMEGAETKLELLDIAAEMGEDVCIGGIMYRPIKSKE